MAEEKGIWVITEVEEISKGAEEDGGKGRSRNGEDRDEFDNPHEDAQRLREIRSQTVRTRRSAEELQASMGEFLEVMEESFARAERTESKMRLEEIELSVEINGEGKVSLLGNGGKAGAKGAIKLKLKRKDG